MKKCPVSEYCGGCQYQGIEYDKQLFTKQEKINSLLSSFHAIEKIIPCKDPYNYRNKVQISFSYDEHHNVICGYYIQNSHAIVPIERCDIASKQINELISSLKKIILRQKISIYDERSRRGCLRHILLRSTNTGESMVVFVTGSKVLNKAELLIRDVLKFNPYVKTIIHNINDMPTSKVLGKRNFVLYGKGYITDRLCGLSFRISAASFYQVNAMQTEVLYEKAIALAGLNKEDVLIDAYCGTGTIGLAASSKVRKVYGVEINASAIKDAKINQKINHIGNIEFILDDAGKYMESLSRKKEHIDAVIMDPPRAGSDIRFMSSMVKLSPDKIVYISCNPDTLKRDLNYLKKYYSIQKIQPVDMFPFTSHCEVVTLITRAGVETTELM
ncbi:MAG: 23S rRNA (uracil(1939)-C(5))-methyltransferase RlmD [Erysipelotrichaceae bacterium]|nr:23S rRNA (uracil(1939)-C(5))-methyltransferase RlmD [Erysipelotrichaceae bacterium]